MESLIMDITAEERDFYGDRLILLEGVISEFLSCMDLIRRYQVSTGRRDPVASFQARIKRADSVREKLRRHALPLTADSALHGIRIEREKDYIHSPKPNGYRSYHMVLTLPLRFLPRQPEAPVWLEVQIRTIAMDCWASIEHQLKYKQDIPEQRLIVQELKRCADEITSTDLSLQTIRELIEASRQEV